VEGVTLVSLGEGGPHPGIAGPVGEPSGAVSDFRRKGIGGSGIVEPMTTTTQRQYSQQTMTVHPLDPARLDAVRAAGVDEFSNPFSPFHASGEGEPLRCCLRFARAGEQIALISWAPFTEISPWREVGPVYVHAEPCSGRAESGVPGGLSRGPLLLRTYRADGSMNYDHNTLIGADDVEPMLEDLLARPDVTTVHVRTVLPQCFLYAVSR
jgi:hypothetical protein